VIATLCSDSTARFVRDTAANNLTGMDVWVIYRRDRYLRGSDQIPFLREGYPAGRFHGAIRRLRPPAPGRPDRGRQAVRRPVGILRLRYTARVAWVNAAALWSLAQAPGTPKRPIIVTTQLTNDTTLRWQRGTEPDLAGYEVVCLARDHRAGVAAGDTDR
jgi:hypothetical protein